jgi:hypothetical protein
MIERNHPQLCGRGAVWPAEGLQVVILFRATGRDRDEPRPDAEGRQAVPGDAVLRRAAPSRTFCECPAGQRMTWHLENEGHAVNEKRIRRLMRLMRLMPTYQKPNTRCPATHACMCERGQARERAQDLPLSAGWATDRPAQSGRPNQVWCADITYIPMRKGFLYLVAIRCPPLGHASIPCRAMGNGLPANHERDGLVHPQGSGLAHLEHAGGRVLPRGAIRGGPQVRPARDHEYRPPSRGLQANPCPLPGRVCLHA